MKTETTKKTPVPPGLGSRGRRYWRDILADNELGPSELVLLAEICKTLDLIDQLDAQVRADGLTVEGSAGQQRLHPAITEIRGQRLALNRLIGALDLDDADDVDEKVPTPASLRAKHAAEARWMKKNGTTPDRPRRRLIVSGSGSSPV
ncbi:P27 family phage terminase small subunit [Isoptericola sp. NPDC056578]|uniref:P27 family phage terminase small subunit n=1 Tax=Isoptericola sp. NPDC056578 TaxID=3345870 RepID=UPI003679E5E0